ncbi:putative MFS family arabinose efflux permease [Enteractinococcus coprophilus]|uniref:Putative MFS family arabinose efflux permease n=2 Tax=Enteractinococcus coprophilus TaxID=1027633 RepID=A0A543AFU9_9MICC|nr:putative MFS family arabinose efflux permease [Enteractinococcus coprophilus]
MVDNDEEGRRKVVMHPPIIPDAHTGQLWTGHVPKTAGFRRLMTGLFFAGVATFAQLYSPQGLLPLIASDLHVTADQAALLISASTIGLALAVIPWSFVGDRLGRKPAMTISIVAACLFGLGATLAPTFGMILGFRILEGVALGGVPALAMAYLNEEVHPAAAGQSAGTFIAGTVLGGLLGRIVAAPVGEWYHWRIGMGVVLVLAIASAVCFLILTPRAQKFTPTTTSARHAITSITTNLRSPVLVVMYLQGMLLMGGFVAVYNFLGFYLLDDPFNLPVTVVSLVFLAYLMGTVSSPWTGRMAAKYRPSRVLMALSGTMIVAILLTLVPNLWVLLAGVLVFTGAFFGAHSVASGWAGAAAEGGRAQSTSLYNLCYYAGSSIFGWLGGIFLTRYGWAGTVWMTVGLTLCALAATALLYVFVVRPRINAAREPNSTHT